VKPCACACARVGLRLGSCFERLLLGRTCGVDRGGDSLALPRVKSVQYRAKEHLRTEELAGDDEPEALAGEVRAGVPDLLSTTCKLHFHLVIIGAYE
jgi:hypothetical protein